METAKADAQCSYEGYKAFQPMQVVWAETMLVLADDFRQGNVPASKDIERLVDEAYESSSNLYPFQESRTQPSLGLLPLIQTLQKPTTVTPPNPSTD